MIDAKRDLRGDLAARLEQRRQADLERKLVPATGLDFASNDYLGFAQNPELATQVLKRLEEAHRAGEPVLGAAASRLLRGHSELHERVEGLLAAFKGAESALFYPSGWQANVGLLTAVVSPQDRVLSDQLNHASLIDGLRLAKANTRIFPHLDTASLEYELSIPWPEGRTFVVTESIFSMDGDLAPLELYAELCETHGAELIVDDAHAVGLWGERGSGLVEHLDLEDRVFASTSMCGKSFGASGAFVAGPQVLIDYLVNASRPFIFSTAVPHLLLYAVEVALEKLQGAALQRRQVHALADRLRSGLRSAGLPVRSGEGPIVPFIVGDERAALELSAKAQLAGFDVRAVRPPTVPAGTSRLRLSVHADHREEDIDQLVEVLAEGFAR